MEKSEVVLTELFQNPMAALAIIILSLTIGLCVGCSPGHLETDSEYRHSSVKWVYHTGNQLALFWGVPMVIDQSVTDLHLGEDCVIVKEGGPGGEFTAPWGQTTALAFDDGRRLGRRKPIEDKWTYVAGSSEDAADNLSVFDIGDDLRVWLRITKIGTCEELLVGKRGWPYSRYVRLLKLRVGNSFGGSCHLVRKGNDRIVLGLWGGHVICFDPTAIVELGIGSSASSDSQPAPTSASVEHGGLPVQR